MRISLMKKIANILAGLWVLTVSAIYYFTYSEKIETLLNALFSGQPR